MARLHSIEIENFRGIESLSHRFGRENLYCLIGEGDSGKSTVLDAIYYVLSPIWNETFSDGDFFNCDLSRTIRIEATLLDIPIEFTRDHRFYEYLRSYNPHTHEITDELDEDVPSNEQREHAITIRLEVTHSLEPEWSVVCRRHEDKKQISHTDRKKLNVFVVSDFVDRHFQWTKWNPLYFLHSQTSADKLVDENIVLKVLRDAKSALDSQTFDQFDPTTKRVIELAKAFGMDIPELRTTIDFRDLVVKEGRFSLHDNALPLRVKGKGSKRLLSMAIQTALCKDGGMMLIDEVEQSLESFRVKHAVVNLRNEGRAQVLMTTHSNDVLEELGSTSVLLARKGAGKLATFSEEFDGLLRSNPQAFFHDNVIVCEGPTEIGVCRAIDRWLIEQKGLSLALRAVGLVNGGGSQLVSRCKLLVAGGFRTVLFCDSDDPDTNAHKQSLKDLGVEIFDFAHDQSIEDAVFKSLPWNGVKELLLLARDFHIQDYGSDPEVARNAIWSSVTAIFVGNCPERFTREADSPELRIAIARASKTKKWFKSVGRGEQMGKICLKYKDEISDSSFGSAIMKLVEWVESLHG